MITRGQEMVMMLVLLAGVAMLSVLRKPKDESHKDD